MDAWALMCSQILLQEKEGWEKEEVINSPDSSSSLASSLLQEMLDIDHQTRTGG